MNLKGIRAYDRTLTRKRVAADILQCPSISGWHESILRSYQIVQKVKELLEAQTPTAVILEIIADLEASP